MNQTIRLFGSFIPPSIKTKREILVPGYANEEHPRILATVSEMFSDRAFGNRLENATEPAAIQCLFGEWTTKDASKRVK